jgi:NADH:ubiquinone oxidoreductase subunit 5 (subunit L)/multisubunit Na+/H+ antiporter MnhA subunit
VGVNPGFPVFGSLVHGITGLDEPFANFVGRTLLEAPPHLEFSWWPVLISFSVFALGVLGGYVLYTARETVLGQPDPVEGIVGADVYRILQNKYYVDEFYVRAFIEPTRWVAETLVSQIIDKGIIDGILAFVARAAVFMGNLFREFNRVVIDGVGDGIPEAIVDAARGLRMVQTGHIQQYLLYALAAILLVGLNLVVLVVFPNLIFWAAIIQVAIALVILALIFLNTSGSRASS